MKTTLLVSAFCAFSLPIAFAQNQANRESATGTGGATGAQTDPGAPGTAEQKQAPAQSGVGEADRAFIMKAGTAGMGEVKMAEMAVNKATSPEVKALAAMIVKDHTKANSELLAIAQSQGVEIPPPDEKEANKKHGDFASETGHDFDTAFLKAMDKCHEKDISLFESSQKNLQDPALKAFVTKTLPVLREHSKQVEMARKAIKSSKSETGEKEGEKSDKTEKADKPEKTDTADSTAGSQPGDNKNK